MLDFKEARVGGRKVKMNLGLLKIVFTENKKVM